MLTTSHIARHGVSAQDMRIILRLESMMEQNQDRRNIDPISHDQLSCLRKRERRTRTFPNTNENDNVQLKTESDWNVDGKVGVGTSIGRNPLPLLRTTGMARMARFGRISTAMCESSFYMMNLLKIERTISHFAKHLHIRSLFSKTFVHWQ